MFQSGFLGTNASFYMDFSTLYFTFLPFLLLFAIRYAIKKEYRKHLQSQITIFIITLIIIVIFEVGIRIEDGFVHFAKHSLLPFSTLFTFLVIHIIIAVLSLVLWAYLIANTYKYYSREQFSSSLINSHKRLGKILFLALSLSSMMGVLMYIFLFVYIK